MKQALYITAVSAVLIAIAGCGQRPAANDTEYTTVSPDEQRPNYREVDGDEYLYAKAISEDEKASGQTAPKILGLRYLGTKDGVIRLKSDNITFSCKIECDIITVTSPLGIKDRFSFSTESVIGSAFLDAKNGFMEESTKK
jgi:predicted small lipoprotein YifL